MSSSVSSSSVIPPSGDRARSPHQQVWSFYDAAVAAVNNSTNTSLSGNDRTVAEARQFLSQTCPSFLQALDVSDDPSSSRDRLIKVGRNVAATVVMGDDNNNNNSNSNNDNGISQTNASLRRLVQECEVLTGVLTKEESHRRRVPTVRFGKTELAMPIVTLGCMRFQASWNRGGGNVVNHMDKVEAECQENLVRLIRYALSVGIHHIETAQGYGCSELQIGAALKTLMEKGEVKREDLIVQTKGGISSSTTKEQYRRSILQQIERLGVDYLDLFGVHGCNTAQHYDWLYNNSIPDNNLIEVLHTLKAEGKVRHYGFSTHGSVHVIRKLLQDGDFDYVNLHHHFIGDYTTSGDTVGGNLDNVRLARSRDMGVFCISPYDKGGRLYSPSRKLRRLCLPTMEPAYYGSLWVWHHGRLFGNDDDGDADMHTLTLGAARPSDLDQALCAALAFASAAEETRADVDDVTERLRAAFAEALPGEKKDNDDWLGTWPVGVPNCAEAQHGTQMGNMVWLYNIVQAYGLWDYAKDRYVCMLNNQKGWKDDRSREENIRRMNYWMPGCAYDPSQDYTEDLQHVPPENLERVKQAMAFVHKWCSPNETFTTKKEEHGRKEAASSNEEKKEEELNVPEDWQIAYDMRPWTAFPER